MLVPSAKATDFLGLASTGAGESYTWLGELVMIIGQRRGNALVSE